MTTQLILIVSIAFILSAVIVFLSIKNWNTPPEPAFLAIEDQYFTKFGLSSKQPETWEDGMRTDGKAGSYEWWYNDAEFEDGTKIVIVFYTKMGFDVPGPAQPSATIDITFPDGSNIQEFHFEEAGTILNASTEKADVQVGPSFLKDMGGAYQIQYSHDDIHYHAVMKTKIPMWRPGTGHWLFGNHQEYYFAWVVPQPYAEVKASLTINGETRELLGTGYHDHNWGNIAMNEVINHWYWGRAKIGDYNVISADIISEKKYGYTRMPVIMVAKDGQVIDDDQRNLSVERAGTVLHPKTQKFIDNTISYILSSDDGTEYKIDYLRKTDILAESLLIMLPTWKRFLARLIGANPTYIRTIGEVSFSVTSQENTTTIKQEGLWEQMFFGSNKKAHIEH